MNERKNDEKNLLTALYGGNAFVKIKQCLEIGKIQFSFVDLTNTKNHIDCYMEAEEFGAVLMASIKSGALIDAIIAEKAKGEQYPKAVWTSPIGGNGTGNNGHPISRYFEISPASKGEVLFTAFTFPAQKNDKGAYIKVKGSKPILTLRIPCKYDDLKILAYKWSFLESDYMSEKYSLSNMRSDYKPSCDDTYSPAPFYDEEDVSQEYVEDNSVDMDDENEVPYVGSESSKSIPAGKAAEVKVVKLYAKTELTQVPNKQIKICKVDFDGTEKRMIFLTDKFLDLKRLALFEEKLKSRVSANKTLAFTAEVCDKGDDLYICKFA